MGEREGTAAACTRRRGKMVGNLVGSGINGKESDVGFTLIVVADIDATVIGSPLRILDIAVELLGEGTRIGAVAIHKIKLGGLMALVAIIEASVGNEFPVGRNGGPIVLTVSECPRASDSG